MAGVDVVVWDIGRVLVQWDFPRIWQEVIPDDAARADERGGRREDEIVRAFFLLVLQGHRTTNI